MNPTSPPRHAAEIARATDGSSCRHRWQLLGALLAFPVVALAAGCGQTGAHAPEKKPTQVVITSPITGEVTDYQDFTGRLDALKTVDIRARVSGFVLTAPFKEGDLVHEGDLLFQIDPQSYQADLSLAVANLRLAKAERDLQEKNAARARTMIGKRAMAQEDYDTSVAAWEKSKASVEAMNATQERVKLYRDWTRVTAPLSGRISRRLVDPGNLVVADTTILTTLVSDHQLYAYFDVDERTYLELLAPVSPKQSSWLGALQFPVLMQLANEEEFSRTGTVNFIDNRVSANTGTIRMRAVFDNTAGTLRSGLFVRIRLPIGKPYQGVLISGEALQSDQGRPYVYILDDKNEVVYRRVTLGQEIHGLRVIKKGLTTAERVVISGMQRVRPGAQVEVKMQDPPKAPESTLGRLLTSIPPSSSSAIEGEKEKGRPGDKKIKKQGSSSTPSGS